LVFIVVRFVDNDQTALVENATNLGDGIKKEFDYSQDAIFLTISCYSAKVKLLPSVNHQNFAKNAVGNLKALTYVTINYPIILFYHSNRFQFTPVYERIIY